MLGAVCSGRESNSHQAATCEPERGAGCRDAVDWVTDISFYAAVVKDMNGLRGQVEGLQRSLYLMRSQQACGSQEQGDGSHEWEHEPEDQYSNAWESYVKWSCEPQGLQRGSELQKQSPGLCQEGSSGFQGQDIRVQPQSSGTCLLYVRIGRLTEVGGSFLSLF